jgi:long-chain fatty acid transport protein
MNMRRSQIALAITAALLSGHATTTQAAFFQLAENSPAALGNAFAGGAASAEDASTVWYNPAGMTRLRGSDTVVGLHFIQPSIKATSANASTANFGPPLGSTPITGGTGGDAGESAVVPNFYYSRSLTDNLFLGFGANAPYGLATDYDDGWAGRYHTDRSEITTVNVNLALAYKLNEAFSVGGGVNYQKLDATLTSAVDWGTVCVIVPGTQGCEAPTALDGKTTLEADDDAFGYNLGLLWNVGDSTRFGLAYRSKMEYSLRGSAEFTYPNATVQGVATAVGLINTGIGADITLPATISFSAFTQLNPQWAVMGDITRTQWSALPELRVKFDSGASDSVVTLNLENSYRYSLGATYRPNTTWTYRAGLAYDESPTPNSVDRTPRLPDADRTWFTLGAGYRVSDAISLDFAYAYIRVDDAPVNKTASVLTPDENLTRGNLAAEYDSNTQILSAQLRWQFK